jgi:peptidoglycan/xylan/chitin deacetylase (PgdA/CDA1 family)
MRPAGRAVLAGSLAFPALSLALPAPLSALCVAGGVLSHSALLYSVLRANNAWFGPVLTRLAANERHAWLTIDDGPHAQDTGAMLALLERHGARATFFLEGWRAARHPECVRAIVAAGHSIGNHTQNHPAASFWAAGPARARRELAEAQETLAAIAGVAPRYFRPVVGMANPLVHRAARELGLILTGWSARGFDGVPHDPAAVTARIRRALAPGAIIALHQRPGAGNSSTLERVLGMVHAEGYRCVLPPGESPLSDAAGAPRI